MKHATKDEEQKIIRLYENGKSQKYISKLFNRSQCGISLILKRNGIVKKYNGIPAIQVDVDEAFFEKIDSNAKAWILGWILSDGYINSEGYNNKLVFISKDHEVISKIRYAMKSYHKIQTIIHDDPRYKTPTTAYALAINRKGYIADLEALGINNKKSQNGIFPNIDKKYHRHFIRGIFEGDGCVRKIGCEIKIMGTKEILQDIQLHFDKIGVTRPKKDLVKYFENRDYNLWTMFYYGKDNINRVGRFLYEGVSPDIRLNRKYEIFRKHLTLG